MRSYFMSPLRRLHERCFSLSSSRLYRNNQMLREGKLVVKSTTRGFNLPCEKKRGKISTFKRRSYRRQIKPQIPSETSTPERRIKEKVVVLQNMQKN